ncbi:hypothetical protein OY671_006105 [Metschnikowia pulcherrima]|nr:hypothetical protein OY671_006105 [Metschnikowia pulcherrima]
MSSEKVKSVCDNEARAFQSKCRQWYVDDTKELGLPAKIEEAVILVGQSPAKAYVQASINAIQSHHAVLIAGKGSNLGKAVAVAEQVKSQLTGRVAQFNKASLHSSLVNPAYKPTASVKNIEVFLKDGESSQDSTNLQSSEQAANDALREIKGHKVYQVPSMAILLVADASVKGKSLAGSTYQVKS